MNLKQQTSGLMKSLPLGKWKIWTVAVVMVISLLLSSCSSKVTDYKTDPGDPSLYKELVNKAERETATLTRKLDSTTQENSKLKAENAKLRALKLKDVDFSQRDQALDERGKTLFEHEERLKREQDELEGARQQLNDSLYQEGVKAGLLKKAEEQIQDLKKNLRITEGRLRFSETGNLLLLLLSLVLLAYIFLDKFGILRAISNERFSSIPTTISIPSIPSQNKTSNAGSLEQGDSDTKALPSENNDQSPVDEPKVE